MINILIVGDDQVLVEKINELMNSSVQHYNLFSTSTARGAVEIIDKYLIDLIVLDADLPDQSGVELAQQIRKIPGCEFVWIIFLSVNQSKETEAYRKTHCYDYYIKPYDETALFSEIERLCRYKTSKVPKKEREFVTIKQRDRYIRILTKDILYVGVIGNNSTIYTYTDIYSLKKISLRKLKFMLPDNFVQCHKSYIVNRDYIEAIQKCMYGWEIRLKNYSQPVPNGEKYKDNIIELTGIIG